MADDSKTILKRLEMYPLGIILLSNPNLLDLKIAEQYLKRVEEDPDIESATADDDVVKDSNTTESSLSKNHLLFELGSNVYYGKVDKMKRKHGKGTIVFPNKSVFEGDFRDGEIKGLGKYFTVESVCIGRFNDCKLQNHGKIYFVDNDTIYEGAVKDNMPHGKGKLKLKYA